MKPVELIRGMLTNSSRPADIVLDPFVGSGSTIIAAEQLRRRCFALELDHTYAQRAILRWERFTGQKAKTHPSLPPVADVASASTNGLRI